MQYQRCLKLNIVSKIMRYVADSGLFHFETLSTRFTYTDTCIWQRPVSCLLCVLWRTSVSHITRSYSGQAHHARKRVIYMYQLHPCHMSCVFKLSIADIKTLSRVSIADKSITYYESTADMSNTVTCIYCRQKHHCNICKEDKLVTKHMFYV